LEHRENLQRTNLPPSYFDFRMYYIKTLFVFFQQIKTRFSRHPAIQRPNALEKSILLKLPTELLEQIVNNLPVTSAASFSLSCRHIYLLIGTQYLENIATSSHETLVFLNLLEHDLPNQIVCNSCRKLHRIQDARKYTENGQRTFPPVEPDCLNDDREAMVTSYIHENFSSTVFKMAMKHYHHFGYDVQSQQLLNHLSDRFSAQLCNTLVQKEKAKSQIRNGSLFTCKRIDFHGTCTVVERDSIFFWICPHLEIESTEGSSSLCITTSYPLTLEEKWSVLLRCENGTNMKKMSWDLSSEIQQCRYCRTEYKVDFKHDDGCTIRFTITIWKDLGQGPEAEEWKAHISLQDGRLFPRPVQFQGEIASVCEREER
jgi:F-box domain